MSSASSNAVELNWLMLHFSMSAGHGQSEIFSLFFFSLSSFLYSLADFAELIFIIFIMPIAAPGVKCRAADVKRLP